MARKGGVPRERVLNALDLSSFREYLRTRKMVVQMRRKSRHRT
jgi:hypothetical protein